MNPDDLIEAAPEIAKGLTAVGAAIPFTSIVKRMLGPAADEVAEMWRDQVRVYRYERQVKLLEKVERIATEAGFTPQAVPPKILFPLLEGASFEDDENLHDMWAALLANAASDNAHRVRPAFIGILRQMAPDEAWVLNAIAEHGLSDPGDYPQLVDIAKVQVPETDCELPSANANRSLLCLWNLEAAYLISWHSNYPKEEVLFTNRGQEFFNACRPPKPKS